MPCGVAGVLELRLVDGIVRKRAGRALLDLGLRFGGQMALEVGTLRQVDQEEVHLPFMAKDPQKWFLAYRSNTDR